MPYLILLIGFRFRDVPAWPALGPDSCCATGAGGAGVCTGSPLFSHAQLHNNPFQRVYYLPFGSNISSKIKVR